MNSSMSPSATYQPSHDGPTSSSGTDAPYDLVCVGFGPAALSIAVALHDSGIKRRVLFLERQTEFAWHSGMLLPSAKMQISFLKDLATFRDPRSHFTFLNYLKEKDRLASFSNLSTFLPRREEFNDYLTWAAKHFDDVVRYGSETTSISPVESTKGQVNLWNVTARDVQTDRQHSFTAKKVVIAVGGFPKLPRALQSFGPKIVHSSRYMKTVPGLLPDTGKTLRVAVIGGGQSAAEIFEDLMERYPHVSATLFTAGPALKPSDDSPFVNEIFDPERVDQFYALEGVDRKKTIESNRATNYSVVRPELIDRLYDTMYHQRIHEPDENKWKHRIIGSRELVRAEQTKDGKMTLEFKDSSKGGIILEEHGLDLVITGTGYVRNAHEDLLQPANRLLETTASSVDRNYRLKLRSEAVDSDCGIWLQGCCEQSHGLSDSLLSILAVRGGEIVDSIFKGNATQPQTKASGHELEHSNGVNGHTNGYTNGHNNGHTENGYTNGYSNGALNGTAVST